jgi:hypothetical protein
VALCLPQRADRDLDWVCRRRAVDDAKQLPVGTTLFLNIGAAALLDPIHGVEQLLPLMGPAERAPQASVLEITEHERISDYDALDRVLASYRAEGIHFALDDVGWGHSTLELLAASSSGRQIEAVDGCGVSSHKRIEPVGDDRPDGPGIGDHVVCGAREDRQNGGGVRQGCYDLDVPSLPSPEADTAAVEFLADARHPVIAVVGPMDLTDALAHERDGTSARISEL